MGELVLVLSLFNLYQGQQICNFDPNFQSPNSEKRGIANKAHEGDMMLVKYPLMTKY